MLDHQENIALLKRAINHHFGAITAMSIEPIGVKGCSDP